MKNIIKISLIILVITTVIYFGGGKKLLSKNVTTNPNPRSHDSWVGDVMPFYDGKQWQIFYLEDHRDGEIGFHPFSLFTTKDFINYTDKGLVIPYVNEEDSQERALGTGSIIEGHDKQYHAFYTAHNGDLNPKEAIMHATSKNLKDWDKQENDTFYGSEQYERDDFRDPFVFYNDVEEKYWMLITTRKNNKGVIAKYESEDLKEWTDGGVFFENDMDSDGNLECPSLVYYNEKWYLSFSDQWPDRVTHYRIADSLEDTFEKPTNIDHWDSNAFYAGQIQQDDNGNLFVFAWIPTKEQHDDNKGYNWGGNLAVHQLSQDEQGNLTASLPVEIEKFLDDKKDIEIVGKTENQTRFTSKGDFGILKAKITYDDDAKFGFAFDVDNEGQSSLNILFEDNEISFYNTSLKYIEKSDPLSTMKIIKDEEYIDLKIVLNNDIIIFYLNGEQTFSTRMIRAANNDFSFFVEKGQADLILIPDN
ncbi:hypothetical protein LZ578_04915 [Jeotgalibaca sp. MA1X17-3]|uniref:hypothetical protein n=1 Tax=Jeotgalibaca sp. MA1X17-3 TaxID=2908211 RepID=UPI001F29515B|nr:hypothetical protein [Jeotgalibaca sp. MA1X17-3]UJF16450.1 hypothetical protein LZ578_04915 [Jeotgalibaca sp. MA1X17-3]